MNSMLEYRGYHATITYDADDELHREISMLAAQQKVTLNQYIINALSKSVASAE